ncbi:MAG: WD40 repeat domain-containing protein [bacterium]
MSKKERRSKMYKIILITCVSIINIFGFLQCGSLLGRAGIMYTTTHNNFRDQQGAFGLVKMTNGFSVVTPTSGVGSTHGSCAFMDTCISVSGAIDLRETNTIFLQSDLVLDHGVTFSSGGNIYGYDRALILNGDLTIPDGKIIHTGGRVVIDGNGHKLLLGNRAQLFVDADATLTLRNLVLQNTRNQQGAPAVQCAFSGSKLCLDDVELAFADDFYFDQGQLFVHDDVAVTGTSAFVYRSTNPSYITAASTFYFNPETTFDFRPSTTGITQLSAKDLLIMQDATSQLYLDGCTLKATLTGMRLTKGQLIFDNKVSITSAAQLELKSTGTWVCADFGNYVSSVRWSPDGRYFAVGGAILSPGDELQIYKSDGSYLTLVTSYNFGGDVDSVSWSYDSKYIAAGGWRNGLGNEIQIYRFNGSSLTLLSAKNFGNTVNSVDLSPNGAYLAVGGYFPSSGDELQIYSFNGSSLTLVNSLDFGQHVESVNWSPDGQYLAAGGSSSKFSIYTFNNNSLTLITSLDLSGIGYGTLSVNWSPDGHSVAICVGYVIQIYNFTGSSTSLLASQSYGNSAYEINWSPDGHMLAVGGPTSNESAQIHIYKFTGSSLNLLATQACAGIACSVDWSIDSLLLGVGNYNPSSGHNEIEVYTLQYGPETDTQALSNSIVFGNSSLGSDYDLNVRLLAGAQVVVDGILNNDNVN